MPDLISSSECTNAPLSSPVGPPMIGALMRLPWEAVSRRLLLALREHGCDDIDGPQLSVLLWPGPDGMRPSDLAAGMRVTKQALNYLLRDLEGNGYLERHPDPDDRRARRIALTDRGRDLIPVLRGAVVDVESEWKAALGEQRFAELRDLLLELNAVVTGAPGMGNAPMGKDAVGDS
jgi:DNA-binding MarR family transcriptional regulator